jgi:CMP-N-acetylneuraminic acid synthetase
MVLEEDIGVFSCGRLTSQRCKNKMTRKFGETSLVDIFLTKTQSIGPNTFFAGYDSIFKEKCEQYGIDFIQRTKESSNSEVAKEIYNFLHEVNYKYLLMVNACIPFLKLQTIKDFILKCDELKKPSFAVFKKNNYFMSMQEEPYNFDKEIKTINTKYVEPVKEFAHIFYFFEREYFLKHDWYWDWNDLNYIEIPSGIETLDIDTEEDFEMASFLWENNNVRSTYQDY